MIAARILADSISPDGVRLVTVEADYPRFIHAEVLTHRVFSRSSASSRAIPLARRIEEVRTNPVIPMHWGRNEPGMVANEELGEPALERVQRAWMLAARDAADTAEYMATYDLHKQVAARILEPYLWHRSIITSTEWSNFMELRLAPNAQPEMRLLAEAIDYAMSSSTPNLVRPGEWHTPYVDDQDASQMGYGRMATMVSAARCARVSYLSRREFTLDEDLALAERLRQDRHLSPFEHVATPCASNCWTDHAGNFRGWDQLRHQL